MDVERRLAAIGILIDEPHLHAVPGRAVLGAHQTALPGRGNRLQPSAEREVDQLQIVDGDIRTGVPSGDPLGELLAGDRLRFEERAVAVVDVLEHAVGDQRPQLFVVRIEQLVVDDLGQDALLLSQRHQFIEFLQRQHRGLFDDDMLARGDGLAGRVEMPVVGRRHANEVDTGFQQLLDGVRAGEVLKVGDFLPGVFLVGGGPLASPGGDSGQFDIQRPEPAIRKSFRMRTFKERTIRFIEDHPEADHACSQDG